MLFSTIKSRSNRRDLNFEQEIPALAGDEKPGEIKVEEANVPAAPSNTSLLLAVSEIDTIAPSNRLET